MQIIALILLAIITMALSYFLFYLGCFFKSHIKMNTSDKDEPIEEDEEEWADDEDYAYDEDDTESTDFAETSIDSSSPKNKKHQANCVISQIKSYYGTDGVYGLAEFLVNNGASFSVHKFNASCLLQWAISYVRFFQDEDKQNMESLINLLLEVEKHGLWMLKDKMEEAENAEKTAENWKFAKI